MGVYRDITEQQVAQENLRKEQDSLRRMLQASDHDRKLFAQEIHEGVAQRLLGALMQFEAVSQMEHEPTEETRPYFEAGLEALRQASVEARRLMNRTRTPVLEEFGVDVAITEFIDQINEMPDGPTVVYTCEGEFERLEPVLENTIFRVVQEAVFNACLHSHSEIVRVKLIQHGGDLTIDVQDHGVGFDPACIKDDCFGLHRIRERTRLLGKDLKIESTPGDGTHIQAKFPLIGRSE